MPTKSRRWLTTTEAAAQLDLTGERVRQLIAAGDLQAQRVGPLILVRATDIETLAGERESAKRDRAARATEEAIRG